MKQILVAILCSLGATTAWAHEIDWKPYAGAAVAQNQFEGWVLGIPDDGSFVGGSIDEEDIGFGIVVGIEPFEHLGFELGYTDFGEARLVAQSDGSGTMWAAGPVTHTFGMTSIDASLIARLPLTEAWTLFGRVGVSHYEAEWRLSGTLQPSTPVGGTVGENKHQSPTFGAGIKYGGLGAWSLVAAWQARDFERPNTSSESRVDSLSLSAVYRW